MRLRAGWRSPWTASAVLTLLWIFLLGFGLTVGPARIGLWESFNRVVQGIQGNLSLEDQRGWIVWQLRLPRFCLATLVGASLALAGAVMQGVFRNPMADPFLVGISSGAALGATTATFVGLTGALAGFSGVPLFAFVGALGVCIAVYVLAYQAGRVPVLHLLLVGIALGAACQGITALLLRLVPSTDLQIIFFWLMGSLASATWKQVWTLAPYLLACFLWLLWVARDLDLLMLGEEEAAALGLRVERAKLQLIAVVSILAAAAVSVSGIIGFVGLVVPHMVRLWAGPRHRPLLVLSFLAGAVLLVTADLVVRAIPVTEIPVGIVTTLLGVPFFLFLLYRKKKYYFA